MSHTRRPPFIWLPGLAFLCSTFSVRADVEIVDGIEWRFQVRDGQAILHNYDDTGDFSVIPVSTTGAVTIPSSLNGYPVTRIGANAFSYCSKITSIVIPDCVTSIGPGAFQWCYELTSISIPDSVEDISHYSGDEIFRGCRSIKEAWIPQCVMTKGLASEFADDPKSLRQLHLGANVSTIKIDEFNNCAALTSIDVADGNESFWVSPTDGCLYSANRKTLFVCPRNATSVELPDELERVSKHAFQNCTSLTNIVFPVSVTSIPSETFEGCTALWVSWFRALANLSAGGCGETTQVSFIATNIVLHYVTSGVQSGAVTPPTAEGLVNVVTEIGASRAIAVSSDWAAQYPGFENLYGTDFGAAIVAENGKTDGSGHPMFVWQDYVAGTDPTDPTDAFTASIAFDATTGEPVIGWSPELPAAEAAKRKYTVFGKVRLNDEFWTEVDGDAVDYNFFKVRVEMK